MSRLTAFSRRSARPRFRVVRADADAVILAFPSQRFQNADILPRPEARTADSVVSICESMMPQGRESLLNRARTLHRNRCCPNCRRGGTIPLDLGDGDRSHSPMPVPGTSTLVGFYCDACGTEWPA